MSRGDYDGDFVGVVAHCDNIILEQMKSSEEKMTIMIVSLSC